MVFIAQVKLCYLVGVLKNLIKTDTQIEDEKQDNNNSSITNQDIDNIINEYKHDKNNKNNNKNSRKQYNKNKNKDRKDYKSSEEKVIGSSDLSYSVIIFVATCKRCQVSLLVVVIVHLL